MNTKDLFQRVKDLSLPLGEYALFGSAPMGIRGLRECHDVDIIVTKKLWNKYKDKSGWILVKTQDKDKYSDGLRNNGIELWKDWWPKWNIKKLIQEAEIIDGLPFVRLEEVLNWKKHIAIERDFEKDFKDIEIIENFLQKNG